PSLTKTVFTLIPLSLVKASSMGWISLGSRVVYRLTSSAAAAGEANTLPASASAPSRGVKEKRRIDMEGSGAGFGTQKATRKAGGVSVNENDYQVGATITGRRHAFNLDAWAIPSP